MAWVVRSYCCLLLLFILSSEVIKAQESEIDTWEQQFRESYFSDSHRYYDTLWTVRDFFIWSSTQYNVHDYYPLNYGIDALTNMYISTGDRYYLGEAIMLIENLINHSRKLSQIPEIKSKWDDLDEYKGWVSYDIKDDGEKPPYYQKEIALSESIVFRYVARLLYVMRKEGLDKHRGYRRSFETIKSFSENHVWTKWYQRNKSIIYRQRLHMASHWAFIAKYLFLLNENNFMPEMKGVYENIDSNGFPAGLGKGRPEGANLSEELELRNLNYSTWNGEEKQVIQDTPHSNHVISYMINSESLGQGFDQKDIEKLISIFFEKVWDSEKANINDCFDGTSNCVSYPGKSNQRAIGDGWAKLGGYNQQINRIFSNHAIETMEKGIHRAHLLSTICYNTAKLNKE